jgi:hypothetical protein
MDSHRFRENISDKSLRKLFNEINQTPNKKYRASDYTNLRRKYFILLDEHKNKKKQNRNENAKAKRILKKQLQEFAPLADYTNLIIQQKQIQKKVV